MSEPDPRVEMLFAMLEMVINADPQAPVVFAAPNLHYQTSRPIGFVLAFNLEAKHDPQLAHHFKEILRRLMELEPEHTSHNQVLQDSIEACIASDEVEVRFL